MNMSISDFFVIIKTESKPSKFCSGIHVSEILTDVLLGWCHDYGPTNIGAMEKIIG